MEIKALREGLHCNVVQQRASPPERAILMPFPGKVHSCSGGADSFLSVGSLLRLCEGYRTCETVSFPHRNFKKNYLYSLQWKSDCDRHSYFRRGFDLYGQ